MLVDADLCAAQVAEILLSLIGASAVEAVCLLLMVDPSRKRSCRPYQEVASSALTTVPLGDARLDECDGLALGAKHGQDRLATNTT
ncbi:MAG: hypothetical protein ACI9HH_004915, partial [Pseudomonadota bacterium]